MISLGIDPSLTATGYVLLEDGKILEQKLIKTKPTNSPVEELERMLSIRNEINAKNINIAVIEGVAFMARNTSALVQLSALNYLIRERLYNEYKKFVIVTPTQLKKFVSGKGNVNKDIMLLEVFKRWGLSFRNSDICDAYGLARIGEAIMTADVKLTKFQKEVINIIGKEVIL